jgi:hypothetical protein
MPAQDFAQYRCGNGCKRSVPVVRCRYARPTRFSRVATDEKLMVLLVVRGRISETLALEGGI